jgi:hypothetical protein
MTTNEKQTQRIVRWTDGSVLWEGEADSVRRHPVGASGNFWELYT